MEVKTGKVYIEAKTFSELKKGDLFFVKHRECKKISEYVFEKIESEDDINKLYSSTCGGYWSIDNLNSCKDSKFGSTVSTNKYLVY